MFTYDYIDSDLQTHIGKRNFKWISNNPHISRFYHDGLFYESTMLKFMCNDLSGGCLIDVGANIGNHSVYAAVTSQAYVEAFEPVYDAFVRANAALNGVEKLINVNNIGLGANDETRHVFVRGAGSNPGATDLVPENNRAKSNTPKVSVARLDSFDLTNVDVIKIDVEGMEEDVILGGSRIISENTPIIYAELEHTERFDRVSEILAQFGYVTTAVFNATPTFRFQRQPVDFERLPDNFRELLSPLPKHKDY